MTFLLKIFQGLLPWLLEKAATAISIIIIRNRRDADSAINKDQALKQLEDAKTEQEVKDAAKNTLGL